MGHEPKLIAPQYVSTKSFDQPCLSVLHRLRESWVSERTAMMNQAHGVLLEFGVSTTPAKALRSRLPELIDRPELEIPTTLRPFPCCFGSLRATGICRDRSMRWIGR